MTVMPRQSYDWTVDDLESLPDDGLQYELLDGAYVEVARADGDEGADVISPFAVRVVPSGLI
jgi:hypothetical protein